MPGEDAAMSQPDPDITDLANIIHDLRQEVVALQQDNKELQDELARAAHAPVTPAMATTATTAEPTQGCPMGYPYGSVKIFPRPKLHIRMQIKMPQNLAIY